MKVQPEMKEERNADNLIQALDEFVMPKIKVEHGPPLISQVKCEIGTIQEDCKLFPVKCK